jgi:flagellar hook assembly protein FlgD
MISFEIPTLTGKENQVDLTIYNSLGEVVRSLVKESILGGVHKIFWSGDNDHGQFVGSGVYFLRLKTATVVRTQKMVLLR